MVRVVGSGEAFLSVWGWYGRNVFRSGAVFTESRRE